MYHLSKNGNAQTIKNAYQTTQKNQQIKSPAKQKPNSKTAFVLAA